MEPAPLIQYYNEVSTDSLHLGGLSNLPRGRVRLADWKACPTDLGILSEYRCRNRPLCPDGEIPAVIPGKAGLQPFQGLFNLDCRRGDGVENPILPK